MCDLYGLSGTLTQDRKNYLKHDLEDRVRLFFWKGEAASSALRSPALQTRLGS
jgi:hypothetical protein